MTDFSHKHADTNHPVMDEIAHRWSPYLYEPRPVETEKLQSCLEAARWAASSFNEQPWRFIIAQRENEEEFQQAVGCLMEANQFWAGNAGVLILTAYSTKFALNDKPNRVAFHDLGLSMGNLSVQAHKLGLHVHQMAGIDQEKIRETYGVPERFEVGTGVAIGYAANPETSETDSLADRDKAPRSRKSFGEFVFSGKWENPAQL